MPNLLYVTCNLRPKERSRTLTLGYEFLEEYVRRNPQEEVQVLDLYRDSIQRIDHDLLNAWGCIERGDDHFIRSDEERRKMSRILRLVYQFGRCDKYVFVTHSLNLWFPAEFKMYIDAICVPGHTYRATSRGAKLLFPDLCRKSLHLHATASCAFAPEQDMSVAYLSSMLNFLGATDQETVVLNGDDPEHASKEEYEGARRRLLDLAQYF